MYNSMEYETFQILFCFLIGLSWGVFYFIFLGLTTGRAGLFSLVAERAEDGSVKVFNMWNLGLVSSVTIVWFLWLAGQSDSFVDKLIRQSWSYLVGQNLIG